MAPSYIEALSTDMKRTSLTAMKIQECMEIRISRQKGFSDDGKADWIVGEKATQLHTATLITYLPSSNEIYPYSSRYYCTYDTYFDGTDENVWRNNHVIIVNLITV